jgi:hypothetical protein
MIESNMSIVVPNGHIKPQKKRPNMSVAMMRRRESIAAVTIVRYAILVMMRIRGSKRKKIFWDVTAMPY